MFVGVLLYFALVACLTESMLKVTSWSLFECRELALGRGRALSRETKTCTNSEAQGRRQPSVPSIKGTVHLLHIFNEVSLRIRDSKPAQDTVGSRTALGSLLMLALRLT